MVQENQTLKGKTIAVTRPREQAKETVRAIEERGGKPYLFPTIEIRGQRDMSAAKAFFTALSSGMVDYVVLMSVNGVQHLLEAAERLGVKDEVKTNLKDTMKIAVGPKTAQEMEKNGISVDLIPEKYTSEGILQCLQQQHAKGKTIYIPRTSEAPPELAEKLRAMGNEVKEVYVYKSQIPSNRGRLAQKFVKNLSNDGIDAIIFTSSLGVKNFFMMLKQVISERKLKSLIEEKIIVVAIGPTTSKALAENGIKVDVMPENHTFNEALDALGSYWTAKKASV
jgi:uroporphyrinogen-III synthase